MKKSQQARNPQPKRYNVHQTLATSYQPGTGSRKINDHTAKKVDSKEKKRFLTWKNSILLMLLLLLTPLVILIVWDVRNVSDASQKLFGDGNVLSLAAGGELKKAKDGRVNVLIVGNSADDPGHAGAQLTDSLMILSMNPETKRGYTLSVPRDLYVTIPDYGKAKINEAYQGVGIEGLQATLTNSFGIDIQYWVIVNYGSVKELVAAVDGITVDIKSEDPRGLYDPNFKPEEGGPLKLANGPQNLDPQTALNLTRARGATYGSYGFARSDFNRTDNQRQVFAAIKAKIDWKLVIDPRGNKPLFDAAANNLQTSIRTHEARPLFTLIRGIPDSDLRSVGLADIDGVNLLGSYQTPNEQSALIPAAGISNFSEIKAAVKKLNQTN